MLSFQPLSATAETGNTDESATYLTPEYLYNGRWTSNDRRVVVRDGERLTLSVLPNHIHPVWQGPGNLHSRTQNLDLGRVTTAKAGTYTATYRYNNGHTVRTTITVDVITAPTLDAEIVDETCEGHDGEIDLTISHLQHGVFYELFYGALHQLPTSWPVHERDQSGISKNGFDIDLSDRHDYFAMRFTATLDVPADGRYEFFTNSDDGSRLKIDGHTVVDNDGLHGMRERSGHVNLTAGNHQIEVTYFERAGGVGLETSWKGPGFGKQHIPTSRLSLPYTIHWSNGSCDEDLTGIDDGTYEVNVKYAGDNGSVKKRFTVKPGDSYVTDAGKIKTDNGFYCIEDGNATFDPPAFETTPAACAGGKAPGYQWQVKNDMNGEWEFIADATQQNYDPAPTESGSKWYRRLSKCDCGPYYYWNGVSEVRDIHVYDEPEATVTFTSPECDETTGSILFTYSLAPVGPSDKIQLSVDGGRNYFDVPSRGPAAIFEDLSAGTYQPRVRWERSDCVTSFDDIVIAPAPSGEITSVGDILTNNASYCVEDGETTFDPPAFETTAATCSNGDTPVYQWQIMNTMGGGWEDIAGATEQNFDPAPRGIGAKWYRRATRCSCADEFTDFSEKRDIHIFPRPDAEVSVTQPSCDEDDASITFTFDYEPFGQNNTLRLSIDGGKTFTNVHASDGTFTFDHLAAGSYEPFLKWEWGNCSRNLGDVTIIEKTTPAPEVTASATRVCSGETVTFSVANPESGVTYNWDFGVDADVRNQTGAGPFEIAYNLPADRVENRGNDVKVTADNGECSAMARAHVTVLDLPSADFSSTDPTCADENGTITFTYPDHPNRTNIKLSVTGTDGSFRSVPDQTGSETFADLGAGTYDLAIMWGNDDCGAIAIGQVTLTDQAGPGVTASATASPVVAGTEVTLTATANGGTAPLTFEWSDGAGAGASVVVTPSENTTYTVTVTDANGCDDEASVEVKVVPAPTASFKSTDPLCGKNDGTITFTYDDVANRTELDLSIDGGKSFTTVNDDSETFTFSNLPAGTYDLEVAYPDGLGGNVSLGSVVLTDQAGPDVTVAANTTTICEGSSTTITANLEGGTAPFNYKWSNGEATESITVSPTENTSYGVTVTDANGCDSEGATEVVVTPAPDVEIVCAEDQLTTSTVFDTDICRRSDDASFYVFAARNHADNAYYSFSNASLVEDPTTGTATLTATATNLSEPNIGWQVTLNLSDRSTVANNGGPKLDDLCPGNVDPTDWYYYLNFTGIAVGTGDLEGASFEITQKGPPFQVGMGASLKNDAQYGASAWFMYNILSQPTNTDFTIVEYYRGDFNFQLSAPTPLSDCFNIEPGQTTRLAAQVDGDDTNAEYFWSNGATTKEISVAPAATTTYSVTVTSGDCEATATQVVTVAGNAPAARTKAETTIATKFAAANTNATGTTAQQASIPAVSTREVNGNVARTTETRSSISQGFGTEVTSEFALNQNYPNPFSTSTTISFDVPTNGAAEVIILDVTGKQVWRNALQATAGKNSVAVDGLNLTSGTYFYSLIWNGQRLTQRMMVTK